MNDDPSPIQIVLGIVCVLSGLLFVSLIFWFMLMGLQNSLREACGIDASFGCAVMSLLLLPLFVLAAPAMIIGVLLELLFGAELSIATTTLVVGLIFGGSMVALFPSRVFEIFTTAASYTVSQPNPRPDIGSERRKAEYNKRETARQKARTDMEDAIHEMAEAQGRQDARSTGKSSRENDQSELQEAIREMQEAQAKINRFKRENQS